jgi:hypothetical protein
MAAVDLAPVDGPRLAVGKRDSQRFRSHAVAVAMERLCEKVRKGARRCVRSHPFGEAFFREPKNFQKAPDPLKRTTTPVGLAWADYSSPLRLVGLRLHFRIPYCRVHFHHRFACTGQCTGQCTVSPSHAKSVAICTHFTVLVTAKSNPSRNPSPTLFAPTSPALFPLTWHREFLP